jgi:hypothetical protein
VWHYHKTPVASADAASFAPLDDHYAKDRTRVFFADTYREGKEYYAISHDRISEVAGADTASFKILSRGYARDARSVYFEGARFAVRDVATFELLDYGFARDRVAGYYHQTEVPGSAGESFAALDLHYAKDARHVFHGEIDTDGTARARIVLVKHADPATFKLLDTPTESTDAEDSRATYKKGKRTPKPRS